MSQPPPSPSHPLADPPWTSSHPPAPGELRLVQAFVNTVDLETAAESLRDPDSLVAFLASWGLVDASATTDPATLRLALELREGLRDVLGGNAGEVVAPSATSRLTALAEELPLRAAFETVGPPRLVPVAEGARGGLARVLAVAAAAAADGSWQRLKVCHRSDCRWAFFDFSKNRRGRWCSMRSCGNAAAARAYRRRRAGG